MLIFERMNQNLALEKNKGVRFDGKEQCVGSKEKCVALRKKLYTSDLITYCYIACGGFSDHL